MRHAMPILPALFPLLAFLSVPVSAAAATWVVDAGGGGHATTVNGGLALSAFGDTVLVRAGTYYETVLMLDGRVLRSQFGPASTILDGSGAGPVLRCDGVGSATVIEGFTLTHAVGDSLGGAIVALAGASPQIRGNHIVENIARYGAAMAFAEFSRPVIEDNLIAHNDAIEESGGIVAIHECELEIRGNVILDNRSGSKSGGAVWLGDDCGGTIEDNLFFDNACAEGGGAIWLGIGNRAVTVERNIFARNMAGLTGGAIRSDRVSPVTIRNNTFYQNSAAQTGGAINAPAGLVYFDHNIVSRCSAPAVRIYAAGSVDCNDVWQNLGADYEGVAPGPGGLSLDPLFCDAPHDDFTLGDISPCVDGLGCGQIGARGIGCGVVATLPVTWGGVKSRFQ